MSAGANSSRAGEIVEHSCGRGWVGASEAALAASQTCQSCKGSVPAQFLAPSGKLVAQLLAPAIHSVYGAYPWRLAQDHHKVHVPQVTEQVLVDNHSPSRGSA